MPYGVIADEAITAWRSALRRLDRLEPGSDAWEQAEREAFEAHARYEVAIAEAAQRRSPRAGAQADSEELLTS